MFYSKATPSSDGRLNLTGTILVIGAAGGVGRDVVNYLSATPGVAKIVAADVNEEAGRKGGHIAKKARLELEEKTGKRVISAENYLPTRPGKRLPAKEN